MYIGQYNYIYGAICKRLPSKRELRHLNFYVLRKNSLETAYKWKTQICLKTAQSIDEGCKAYYPILGYQSIENEKQLRNMTNYHRRFNSLLWHKLVENV